MNFIDLPERCLKCGKNSFWTPMRYQAIWIVQCADSNCRSVFQIVGEIVESFRVSNLAEIGAGSIGKEKDKTEKDS